MPTLPETLFAEFRRSGDANALASAFDLTAPELLRVAAFLLPRDEVEDAVHDTYVVAMSRHERWDDQRPLLPWLLGVLANEARQRRRRRRLHARTVLPGAAAPDPVAAAQAAEFSASFTRALAELPQDDAALLRLHLCDELTCREIGERLHRPAGTVRTQVSRAMSDLRRRLPVGLGVGAAFGELAPTALTMVKARVLASGSAVAPAVAVAARRARRAVAYGATAAGLLLTVGAAWLAGLFGAGAPPTSSAAVVATAPPAAPIEPGTPPSAAPATPIREGVTLPSPPPAITAPPWELRGRVHGEDGVGIANAWVLLRHGEFEPVIASTRSGAGGAFALDLSFWRDRPALDRQRGFFVKAHALGHNSYPHFGEFPDDARADQSFTPNVDFELTRYATLSGRVVDPNGRPVPALVMVDKIDDENHSLDMAHAETDGTFVAIVGSFDEVKRVRVHVTHVGGSPLRLEVDIHEGVDRDLGTLTLAPGHPVQGRLELRDGTPVPDCEVSVSCPDLRRVRDEVRTDAAGGFTFCRPQPVAWVAQPTGVSVLDGGTWGPTVAFDAADTHGRVVLDAALLELHWFDPEGRELLPQYAVAEVRRAGGDAVMAQQNGDLGWLVVPPGSRVTIRSILRSGHVVAEDLVAPAGGRQRFDLRFQAVPRAPFRVEVTWNDGKPVEQYECQVLGQEPGAEVWGQRTAQAPGHCEWLAPIGQVRVTARGYSAHLDGGEVEVDAIATADGAAVARVVLPRLGRIALTLRDTGASERVDDEFSADVRVGAVEVGHFVWTVDGMETTSSEPPLGRRLETLQLLPPGRHEVVVEALGWLPAKATVDVVADQVADVVVWLQKR